MGKFVTGHKHSPETIKKISDAAKKRKRNPHFAVPKIAEWGKFDDYPRCHDGIVSKNYQVPAHDVAARIVHADTACFIFVVYYPQLFLRRDVLFDDFCAASGTGV